MEREREIQEKYALQRLLGEGGEGKTYLAYDKYADRRIVVKELNKKPTDAHMAALEKLIRLGKIQGMAQLFDVFDENQTCYMVLEYVDGQNGAEYLRAYSNGIPVPQMAKLMEPVANGLSLLHSNGLLHRDVSTDNILITPQGNALLTDFSMLCEYDENGALDSTCKVKSGFSPLEMYLANGKQGKYVDVYEVCATMYHLLTGKILAAAGIRDDGEDPFAGMYLHLPVSLSQLMRQGLAVKCEKRLDSLPTICKALEQIRFENSTQPQEQAKCESSAQLQEQTAGRKGGMSGKSLLALGIVCVLLIIFAGGFIFYQSMNDDDTEETSAKGENKSSNNTSISLDELTDAYTEYMEKNKDEFEYVNGYKLVDLNDDGLPECILWRNSGLIGIQGFMYYNQDSETCEYATLATDYGYNSNLFYSETGNIFATGFGVLEEVQIYNNYGIDRYYYQFDDTEGIKYRGYSILRHYVDPEEYRYSIATDEQVRENVSKAEYEDYVIGFGELSKVVGYEDMHITLDKAYEKYLMK